jgi:hypothetical protein
LAVLEAGRLHADRKVWRDSTTHAPVPLWQVAKRLGVEHPVPPEVRWTDVEWLNDDHNLWESATTWPKSSWISCNGGMDARRDYRLTAQYDHQPISCAQFREILGRENKPNQVEVTEVDHASRSITLTVNPAPNVTATDNPLYEVGDKVRINRGVNAGLTAEVDQAAWDPRRATGAVRLHRDGVSIGWHDYDEVEFVSRGDD